MLKSKYILLNIFFINILSNSLVNVDLKKSNLSDEFLLKFEKSANLIFYKESILNKDIKEATFLIPKIYIKDLDKLLKSLNKLDISYKFRFEFCQIPLNGVKIKLTYNYKNFNLEYGSLKNSSLIFFKLNKKDMLNLINQNIETFRWYAKSKDYIDRFIYV